MSVADFVGWNRTADHQFWATVSFRDDDHFREWKEHLASAMCCMNSSIKTLYKDITQQISDLQRQLQNPGTHPGPVIRIPPPMTTTL